MKTKTPSVGFQICDNKGFWFTFENGWTVSVQFGGGNYCANYDFQIGEERKTRGMESSNAEVAVFSPNGHMQRFGDDEDADTVAGYYTPAKVLALLNEVAAKPKADGTD